MSDKRYYLGLDLGQRRDFSALATFELDWLDGGQCATTGEPRSRPQLSLIALDRFPLGTDYCAIPLLLHGRILQIGIGASPPKDIIIDGGGPGPAVIDAIRHELGRSVNVRPILITSGRNVTSLGRGYTGVPRRTLITSLLLMIGNNNVKVPSGLDNGRELEQELASLRAGTTHPERATAHDDLVIAVALAAWGATRFARELAPRKSAHRATPWQSEGHAVPRPPSPRRRGW